MFHIEDIPTPTVDDLPVGAHGMPDWLLTVLVVGGILAGLVVIAVAFAHPGLRRRRLP